MRPIGGSGGLWTRIDIEDIANDGGVSPRQVDRISSLDAAAHPSYVNLRPFYGIVVHITDHANCQGRQGMTMLWDALLTSGRCDADGQPTVNPSRPGEKLLRLVAASGGRVFEWSRARLGGLAHSQDGMPSNYAALPLPSLADPSNEEGSSQKTSSPEATSPDWPATQNLGIGRCPPGNGRPDMTQPLANTLVRLGAGTAKATRRVVPERNRQCQSLLVPTAVV